jgi:xanthine/uracil permease
MFILAGALAMGLIPIVVPGFYSQFSSNAQILLGNGLAMGVFTAIVLNILFHHVGSRGQHSEPANAQEAKAVES